MQKSQVTTFTKDLFEKIKAQRYLSFIPGLNDTVSQVENYALKEETDWMAPLPEAFSAVNVVDALFAAAGKKWPDKAATLNVLKIVVDAIMTAVPALTAV